MGTVTKMNLAIKKLPFIAWVFNTFTSYAKNRKNILYYKAKSLCICLYVLSAELLTNRLMQALKIRIDYSV